MVFQSALRKILNGILPPLCPITKEPVEESGLFSASGWTQLNPITPPFCSRCGMPFPHSMGDATICAACLDKPPVIHRMRGCLRYEAAIRPALLAFKHGDATYLAEQFTTLLAFYGAELLAECDLIVPVPLHRWRLLHRRYNQAAILAAALARRTHIETMPDALVRTRSTDSQGHKSRLARLLNVKGAITVNPDKAEALRGKRILMVDDVITTGATMNACAKALYAADASTVDGLAVARVVLNHA